MPINATKSSDTAKGGKMLEDPRLSMNNVRVPSETTMRNAPCSAQPSTPTSSAPLWLCQIVLE